MRRLPLWPAVIATGTLIVLGLFLVFILRNVAEMRVLRDQNGLIEHTVEVQRELDAVLIAESEADANVRAFLLTASPQVLETVRQAQQSTIERLDRLTALVADNPTQQQRMKALRDAVETRRQRVDRVIAVRQGGSIDQAMAEARAADTTAPREAVRRIISEMEQEEGQLLATRRETANDAFVNAVNGRVGSGIVSAVLLIGIVVTAGLHARYKAIREQALIASEQRANESASREQEARSEAERANREKDQFLAVLSHELRTPLNAVLGWTQILQAAEPTEPTIVRALASIRRNAELQQRLVEDLLDVSRIVSGKLPFEREAFDLRSSIAAALESVRPSAETKGVSLEARLATTPQALGDAGRIQQVAANLLSNAIKFTPKGGHVAVTLEDGGDVAVLEVADNGAGLQPDLQPHIFERFRQGDGSTTRAHGGLGLGLAIAKHIVEAHGGAIAANSDGPETGATFRVRLPYR